MELFKLPDIWEPLRQPEHGEGRSSFRPGRSHLEVFMEHHALSTGDLPAKGQRVSSILKQVLPLFLKRRQSVAKSKI